MGIAWIANMMSGSSCLWVIDAPENVWYDITDASSITTSHEDALLEAVNVGHTRYTRLSAIGRVLPSRYILPCPQA
jgi:hypothetical protein